MKATEQYFPVVLFTLLYKSYTVVLTFAFVGENPKSDFQVKAIVQYCQSTSHIV